MGQVIFLALFISYHGELNTGFQNSSTNYTDQTIPHK